MIHHTLNLKERFPNLESDTPLTLYIPDIPLDRYETPPSRPTVVICPGGGYRMLSKREAEPIALAYNAAGFNAAILYYSTVETEPNVRHPQQLWQVCGAVATVREHAKEWYADPAQIYLCGFSAGGHAACHCGVCWHLPSVSEALGVKNALCRPDGMILCYPVITSDPAFAHKGSITNLLGKTQAQDPALWASVSLEQQVSDQTPPAFLWHTFEDATVPVKNSLAFILAMKEYEIPTEFHLYPKGRHGLSLATDLVGGGPEECQAWMPLSIDWIRRKAQD